ncbi:MULTISPECIES: nitroreductase family protein [Aneurinibacillus]|jgi:nitroreductase|uniref:Nitroreductase n=1 Tax=Aneurinibacillus thermoaerophilus TaxID=143495 RepID=A0A1G8CQM0_ANETH|nr:MULTISPECIES: nitroreductase family protein [Aneurinibacillus]AMA71840.1 NAD(P)H nitroreductase [Aneurinibacillus sp. XH2]MED0677205.1 nitroreductase family protein [Aneurinibacillus thermoaerophilus]MED0680487.1 nitroreductase family protein [Aneurinibacillus thermoaerophilus]MED0737253.1 nitroreductase family protein [Aneurinibacillus thermoaerophilus]MED0757932.1 nitroreductase family protein [Aneurinibacillus thermoaerophilus]
MEYNEFKEIVLGRRSVRKFTEQPVSAEQVKELIDCARYAPSDTNSQTWEFIAILDKQKIQEISDMTWEELHKIANEAQKRGLQKEGRLLTRSFGPYATAFTGAPALIVCLATPYTSKFRDKIFEPLGMISSSVWEEEGIKSSCLAAQNLMLAAHAMGMATCPMTGPVLLAQERLRDYLQIGSEKQINMVIALGYPAETPAKLPRKPVEEILHII